MFFKYENNLNYYFSGELKKSKKFINQKNKTFLLVDVDSIN